ncbi:hypothetical protein BN946_scf184461.g3 [Trametes cinnabarina]|uniref:Uncharacterized protein n=1 Tax=Pycnoporus cinnabarinus TaxID=5643 RepID=A0A060SL50_PYCCI|nr:hypothetical protein BN946_scf184461.g3 [Trametes cinnabarina]
MDVIEKAALQLQALIGRDGLGGALHSEDVDGGEDGREVANPEGLAGHTSKRRCVIIEEIEDEDYALKEPWVIESYEQSATEPFRFGVMHFENLFTEQEAMQQSPYAPFKDEEEWGLARWLFRQTTQTGADEFLKLPINRTRPSFKNKKVLFKKIDQLPAGSKWHFDVLTVEGNVEGPNGQPLFEELELWRRCPVDTVRELIDNPAFRAYMAYAAVKMKRDGVHFYSEMNTADWWGEVQIELPEGACIAPVILASDKTTLTVLRGDKTTWPVYLTIGNIDKSVRRKPSAHAVLLIGYIPVSKLHCFSKAAHSEAGYRLFHTCMAKILQPLIEAAKSGIDMICTDGVVRRVYPILAAYLADHPEQCLVACCKENRCLWCVVPWKQRGNNRRFPLRKHTQTAEILRRTGDDDEPPSEYTKLGLRPVYEPFWADLPHCDIFASITPDILHQLHKGVIKDHLLNWVEKIVGKSALDERFCEMSRAHGLRHFSRGILVLSQWTGGEAKEIEKVLLGILVGQVSSRVLKAIRALLDFTYYAQYETHSDKTLRQMRQALDTFHHNKSALIELGVWEHFNIPKLHSLIHYVDAIVCLGCLDGVNTENSECLHIDYVKKAYRRQEALKRRQAYLAWYTGLLEAELKGQVAHETSRDKDEEEDSWAEDEDDGSKDSEGESDDVAVVGEDQPDDENVKALRQLVNSNVARAYHVPLMPTACPVSLATLTPSYGAPDFQLKLNEFLRDYRPGTPPATERSTFDLYHSLSLLLPPSIHISNEKRICRLRAVPAVPRVNDKKAVAARFDLAQPRMPTSAAAALTASPAPASGVDPSSVPNFGVVAGMDPNGTGNCIGINTIKIPCSCPPLRDHIRKNLF